jgi:hypothetical protein
MGLTTCFKKVEGRLDKDDLSEIRSIAKALREDDGVPAAQANAQAVDIYTQDEVVGYTALYEKVREAQGMLPEPGVFASGSFDPDTLRAVSNATAPEHISASVFSSVADVSAAMKEYYDVYVDGEADVGGRSKVFLAPGKKDVVRLQNKVKQYVKDKGWMTPEDAQKEIENWQENARSQSTNHLTENASKVVLSLFDLTGNWAKPWAEAGYQVYTFDIQNDPVYGDIHNFDIEMFSNDFGDFWGGEVYAILAACPCTDFASSGARHFETKDNDGRTVDSMMLVDAALSTIEYFKPAVWAVENPVGRIGNLTGMPPWRLSFDPNHFGEDYTKKTLLWGRFNGDMPVAPTEATEGSKMHSKYGGKSMATKNARSATPMGFAYSFFQANNAVDNPVMATQNLFDAADPDLIAEAVENYEVRDIKYLIEDSYYDYDFDEVNERLQDLIKGEYNEEYSPKNDPMFSRSAIDAEEADITSPEFKKWAGTDSIMDDSYEINSHTFTEGEPVVMKVYHGTTNGFQVFDSSVRGNVDGFFGRVNYFTSSLDDADVNYRGLGPDLTNRIVDAKKRIYEQIVDAPGAFDLSGEEENFDTLAEEMAEELASEKLDGGQREVKEVYVRTENPFVVSSMRETNWIELYDREGAMAEAQESIADVYGVSSEEVMEEYEQEVYDEMYDLQAQRENPITSAIEKAARDYDFNASSLMEELYEYIADGEISHNRLHQALRVNEELLYIDGDEGELMQTEVIASIIENMGFDSIILKDADRQFSNMDMGSEVAHIHVFDKDRTNIKSVYNTGSFDPGNPDIDYSSRKLREGDETLEKYGVKPGGAVLTRKLGEALEKRQRDKWGVIDRTDRSEEAGNKIAEWMADEVKHELERGGNDSGAGWYSEKFQTALDIMGSHFPELKEDQSARDMMTAIIAVTSDGQKVVANFAQAVEIYENYRKTGEFSTNRGHIRQASILNNLNRLNSLKQQHGDNLHDFLLQEETVSRLKQIAKENGDEMNVQYQATTMLPMAAALLGPKLGAFYANLMGSHGYLTMDLWWSRTFNRYRGLLTPVVPGSKDRPTDTKGRKIGLAKFKEMIGEPTISDNAAKKKLVPYAESYAAKNWKNGTDIEKTANTLYKKVYKELNEAPFNSTDRTFMIETAERAQKILKKSGSDISIADIQAILWYYEKRLYAEMGARASDDLSYEEAAQRVIDGISQSERPDPQVASDGVSGGGAESQVQDGTTGDEVIDKFNAGLRKAGETVEVRRWLPESGLTGEQEFTQLIADNLGVDLNWIESNENVFDGAQFGGQTFIDVKSEKPYNVVLGHEFTHVLKREHPDLYQELHDLIIPQATNAKESASDHQYKAGSKKAQEEFVADVVGNRFGEKQFWSDLAAVDPKGFRRIAQAVRAFLDKVLAAFRLKSNKYGDSVKDLEEVRKGVASVMVKYKQQQAISKEEFQSRQNIPAGPTALADDQGGSDGDGVMFSRSESDEESMRERFARHIDRARFQMQDKLIEGKRLTENAGPIQDPVNFYQKASIWEGRAGEKLNDFDEEYVQPLLDDVAESNLTMEQVGEWLVARHAPEANAHLAKLHPKASPEERFRMSGMSDTEAEALINLHRNNQALDRIGRRIDQINRNNLSYAVADGLMSQEDADTLREKYRHYVPLYREAKDDNLPMSHGKGFQIRGKESKRRVGSAKLKPTQIISNTLAQSERYMVRGEKNRVGQSFLEFIETNEPEGFEVATHKRQSAVVRVPNTKWRPVSKAKADRLSAEDEWVEVRQSEGRWEMRRIAHEEVRQVPSRVDGKNEFTVKRGGKEHTITVDPEDERAMRMIAGMKNLEAPQLNWVFKTLSQTTRFLSNVNTSWNPEFVISNFFRDIQTAGYNLSDTDLHDMKMAVLASTPSAMNGIRSALLGDGSSEWAAVWEDFRKSGGKTGWIDLHYDISDKEADLKKMVDRVKEGKPTRSNFDRLMRVIDDVNTTVENGVRLSAYKAALDKGLSKDRAAALAKDLTVNFNRKGNMGPTMNALYMFYNAATQGSVRLLQAMVYTKKGKKLALATVGFAVALDLMNRALSGEDDDGENIYDNLPDYVKDHNLIIMGEKEPILKLPLPWGYNVLHTIGQVIGGGLSGKASSADAMRIATSAFDAFNPVGSGTIAQMMAPTLADPIVQMAENKSFAGQPLKPEHTFDSRAPKPEYLMHWSSARETSKDVAKWLNDVTGGNKVEPGAINVSPEWIDLMVDFTFGGLGRTTASFIDAPVKIIRGEELPTENVPFLRKVTGYKSDNGVKFRYYEWTKDVAYAEQGLKQLKGSDREELLNQPRAKMIGLYKMAEKQLRRLRKSRRLAAASGDTERTDMLDERMREIMAKFNRKYSDKVLQN